MILKLVDDWKDALRWFSVNCMLIAATIQGVWASLPEDMRASIPTGIVSGITIFVLVLGVIGRLVKQERRKGKKNVDDSN